MRISNAYIRSIASDRYKYKCDIKGYKNLTSPCSISPFSCIDKSDERNLTFLVNIPKDINEFSNNITYKNLIIDNLKKYKSCDCIQNREFSSIYFSGLCNFLKNDDYKQLMNYFFESFNFNRPEVIFELDGIDVKTENVMKMMDFGFNKLIIDIKSFDKDKRNLMGLSGDPSEILENIKEILDKGFKNIYIKISYNYENFDNETLVNDMQIVNALDLAGFVMVDEKKLPKDELDVRKSFSIMSNFARDVCYDFSRKDQMTRCRRDLRKFQKNIKNHNDIIPIGLGAKGHIGENIIINPTSIENFIKLLEEDTCVFKPSKEYLKIEKVKTMVDEMFIDPEKFDADDKIRIIDLIKNLLIEKFVEKNDEIYTLTDKGIYWCDQVKNELIEAIL